MDYQYRKLLIMKFWILFTLLYPIVTFVYSQNRDSTYGKWWVENRDYQTFSVELGKTYQLKSVGSYDFWHNGAPLPVIQNDEGEYLLHIPSAGNHNTQVYATRVQDPSYLIKLDQLGSRKDSLKSVSEFIIEKQFVCQEYYSKETIGPEQLLRNSSISTNESWGLRPTHHEQIVLNISDDTVAQLIDFRIKNLGYANDLEVYLNGQFFSVYENLKPYEVISFQIGRDIGLTNSSTIGIKSKNGPQHKFSVVGLKLTGMVNALPLGPFKLSFKENWLFIPGDSNNFGLKIMDWEDGKYFTPQMGEKGWGFYLKSNKRDKIFTTLSQPYMGIDLESVKRIVFREEALNKNEYLIIVAEELLNNSESKKKLEDYIAFRNKKEGGEFIIKWMNYETIYHQYGFGAKNSYLGLFNYFRKLKSKDLKPKIVWFIGKGYGQDYQDDLGNLIPSYGFPASDFLLVNDQHETHYSMVARLAVSNGTSLVEYLQKVMDHERRRSGDSWNWRKDVLHIAGGKNAKELDQNIAILQNAWNSDLTQKFGMKLFELHKPIMGQSPTNLYGELLDRWNKGLGIRVFLGHGGVTSTEIGLDSPELLPTSSKIPLMMDLGCQTGDIFTRKNSLSEQFTLASNRGAISYVGSSGYGYSSSFSPFLAQFYQELSNNQENKTIGEIFLTAIQPLQKSNFYGSQILAQQLNFHGDPFIKLFDTERPDYVIADVSSGIDPSSNKLLVQGSIINRGRLQEDAIEIIIQLDGVKVKRDTLFINGEQIAFKINFLLPLKASLNYEQLVITCRQILDDTKLLEQDTINNLFSENTISWRGLVDLKYPYNHSILSPENFLGLVFEANYSGDYCIELDTSHHFFNPKRFFKTVKEAPVLMGIKLDKKQLINNQRYFWRINKGIASTFFYSQDRKGAFFFDHPIQFKPLPALQRSEEFSLLLQAVVRTEDNQLRSRFFRDGLRLINAGTPVAFYVVVIEPATGRLVNHRIFEANSVNYQVEELIAFLEGGVENNHLVSIFTFHHEGQRFRNGPGVKGENCLQRLGAILKQEGARKIDVFLELKQVPYLIVYQKGKGVISELVGSKRTEKIEVLINMGEWTAANHSYETSLIGPAEKWDSVEMNRDLGALKLSGVKNEGADKEWLTLQNSGRLDRRISNDDYLAFQIDKPIDGSEIEVFAQLKDRVLYDIFLERNTITEGQPLQVLMNGLTSIMEDIPPSSLCFTLKGKDIKRDTCVELPHAPSTFLAPYKVQLWGDIPVGEYQLLSDWNGEFDSLSFFIQPFRWYPEISFLINGEGPVQMQSFKSGKRIRIQIKSLHNHYFFEDNPSAAIEVRLKDSDGKLQEINKNHWKVEVNPSQDGLTIQLDGAIRVDKNGIYTIEIIPKAINGILLENLKKTSVIDIFLNQEVEKIKFFPNPYRGQLGLSFYYWGDQLPDSFTVALIDRQGNLVKEVDLVQTGQIQMGKNFIIGLFGVEDNRESLAASVYYYLVKVNNERIISGRLIKLKK